MYDSGFDPHAMVVFFSKIEEQTGSRGAQWLSDHPNPGNRAQAVAKEEATLPRKSQYSGDSAEFLAVKREVAGMQPLTSQQISSHQRPVEGDRNTDSPISGAEPTANTSTFRHNDYTISYPQNWQILGDQNSAVTIAPSNGLINSSVAYRGHDQHLRTGEPVQ